MKFLWLVNDLLRELGALQKLKQMMDSPPVSDPNYLSVLGICIFKSFFQMR